MQRTAIVVMILALAITAACSRVKQIREVDVTRPYMQITLNLNESAFPKP